MSTGSSHKPGRRGDTRQRIQDITLELIAEQGYEKTSLREIAERLGVTKAALYYHFKTKEDILVSLFQDLTAPIDELIEWAAEQPHTMATKQEILTRYGTAMVDAAPLFRFMQENQATVRELSIGNNVKDRATKLVDFLLPEDASLADRVRCFSALISMHAGMFMLKETEGDPEEKRRAILEVATELVTRAHEH
ncbi:TetR/AcrR family transcriptional regulator [Streptomyces beihaiensis]|uniref:TetR/AcrR family transcriptional regulator n=1 Tax=Streptomyces beihaiensis TaxID=2984495 RepID=A0ABT3TN05_9ACTN|nr:TetR/AcrR family transcriptional regulator [Streptomyces beihaiensis]MCX3058432.1 TetR/AcrR family transcriptional regulator [Streptomyces beihaiensis]